MTVDKLGTLQKSDVSLHEKSEGGFKPLALDDVTTMYSNADYHKTQSTAAEASKEKIASQFGSLKIENSATDAEAHSIYSSDEFRQRSESIFSKVDRDGDGLLSDFELTNSANSKRFDSKDVQVIESLRQNQDRFKTLSDNEWGDETGIAMEDVDQLAGLDERAKRYEIDAPIEAWFGHSNNFAQVDADGDGYVSNNEIETRLNSKKIDKLEANALERMRTTYAELMNQSNDEWGSENNGISRADINAHVTGRQQTAREIDAAKHALNVMHRVHKQQHPDENAAG